MAETSSNSASDNILQPVIDLTSNDSSNDAFEDFIEQVTVDEAKKENVVEEIVQKVEELQEIQNLRQNDNSDDLSTKKSRALRDEPISESEFQLLFVNLENLDNNVDPLVRNHCQTTHEAANGLTKNLPNNSNAENDNFPIKRGRGRPKGSTNKNTSQKMKKKDSKAKKKRFARPETDLLPERLKKKVKVESDIVINLTKRIIAPVAEKTFELKERVDNNTWKLLEKKSITCTLCHKPGNFAVLGSLFGPYRLIVEGDIGRPKEIRSQKDEKVLTIRLHRDCCIWTPGICLIESELRGMAGAVSEAARKKCNICSEIGASLVCLNGACTKSFHYVCAKQIGCGFNSDDLTIRCPDHK